MPLSRYFRFRLRTMLVVVFVASLPLASITYSLNWIRERERFLAASPAKTGVLVWEAYGFERSELKPMPLSLRLFGARPIAEVVFLWWGKQESRRRAEELFPEARFKESEFGRDMPANLRPN